MHPKDPYKRIQIVASTRALRVSIAGHVVATSPTAMHLYETGLPVRYYMPLTFIDPSILRPSDTRSKCPYKGEAEYYHAEVGGQTYKDIVWFYTRPTLESAQIEGLCCFYNEKVDMEIKGVDGEWEKLERPKTYFG